MKSVFIRSLAATALAAFTTATMAQAQSRYDELANLPFVQGYVAKDNVRKLLDESFFERGVQAYLWAMPALNMYSMKEGSEKVFGKGYNVLPVWKQRLNAKTLITTPNSDVIYALGYLDLKEDGPIVIELPPNMQGILDDFWQRPIPSVGEIDGRKWAAMWVCPDRTGERAAITLFCRRTIRARFRRAISPFVPARTACSSFGAPFSKTQNNSKGRCG